MIDRETMRIVLDRLLAGEITYTEVSAWVYEMLTQYGEPDDPLVTEVLYNLVSFKDVGQVFAQQHPCREKLEYFANWLEEDGECNWDQYTIMFDPCKLM